MFDEVAVETTTVFQDDDLCFLCKHTLADPPPPADEKGVVKTECRHFFHGRCMQLWLRSGFKESRCPE